MISSIDIENVAVGCPGVKIAAVVGVFHPKWEARQILVIECMPECSLNEANVRAWLEPRLVKWWLPDQIIFADVPLTATGRTDKKALRTSYKDRLMA